MQSLLNSIKILLCILYAGLIYSCKEKNPEVLEEFEFTNTLTVSNESFDLTKAQITDKGYAYFYEFTPGQHAKEYCQDSTVSTHRFWIVTLYTEHDSLQSNHSVAFYVYTESTSGLDNYTGTYDIKNISEDSHEGIGTYSDAQYFIEGNQGTIAILSIISGDLSVVQNDNEIEVVFSAEIENGKLIEGNYKGIFELYAPCPK